MGKVFSKLSFLTSSYCEEPEGDATDNYISDNPENQRWEADSTSAYSKPLWTSELCHNELVEFKADVEVELNNDIEELELKNDGDDLGLKYLFSEEELEDPELDLDGFDEYEDENLNIYKVFMYYVC